MTWKKSKGHWTTTISEPHNNTSLYEIDAIGVAPAGSEKKDFGNKKSEIDHEHES